MTTMKSYQKRLSCCKMYSIMVVCFERKHVAVEVVLVLLFILSICKVVYYRLACSGFLWGVFREGNANLSSIVESVYNSYAFSFNIKL